MATNDDMNMYNSKYTGKQIDDSLDIIYTTDKDIPLNSLIATNENGKGAPIKISELGKRDIGLNISNGGGDYSLRQKYNVGDKDLSAIATGINAVAFGGLRYDKSTNRTPTSASGNQSFAAGGSVHAEGDFSAAFGKDTVARQRASFATGSSTAGMTEEEFNTFYWDSTSNTGLHGGSKNSDGEICDFTGAPYVKSFAFAAALGCDTQAKGARSFTAGDNTVATNVGATAIGMNTNASGVAAFAEGYKTVASGEHSHAGGGQFTQAKGLDSFAHGANAEARADRSAAFGFETISASENGMAIGKQNVVRTNALFQVGNGMDYNNRRDAFAVLNDGRAKVQAAPVDSDDVVRLAELKGYVDLSTEQTIEGSKTFRSSVAVQNSDGSKKLSLSYQSIQIGSSEFTFPQNGGILALKDDIPSLPTNYVTSNTEQTINGLKTFVGGLNIQGNNLNIAPDGNLVFNTSNGQKIRFVLPTSNPTGTVDITLPITSKDMNEIGNGGSGSTTLQFVGTNYGEGELDTKWTESPQGIDAELGKYYVDVGLEEGDTIVSIRTTSNYGLSENSITTLGANKETWPEIKNDNRLIIETNEAGTISKKVRIYSNAKISGRAQIAVRRQS